MTDPIPEAPIREGRPAGPGWFVLNVAEARWVANEEFGAYTSFEGDDRFEKLGINIGVLQPGQAACYYHREGDQEEFLVIQGEALLIVEGEERRLRTWDLFHCPDWTAHVIVGTGDGPCTILAVGSRTRGGIVYPVDESALGHRAGVARETRDPQEAYADVQRPAPTRFDPDWLPGGA